MEKKYVRVDGEKLGDALNKILECASGKKKEVKLSQNEAVIISVAVAYAIQESDRSIVDEEGKEIILEVV